MKPVPEAPPGAKGPVSTNDAEPKIYQCARPVARGQVIPFSDRRAALERGLAHLMRALALFPACVLLVLFGALIAAERARVAVKEVLAPERAPATRDGLDRAACDAWAEAAVAASDLRRRPCWRVELTQMAATTRAGLCWRHYQEVEAERSTPRWRACSASRRRLGRPPRPVLFTPEIRKRGIS